MWNVLYIYFYFVTRLVLGFISYYDWAFIQFYFCIMYLKIKPFLESTVLAEVVGKVA